MPETILTTDLTAAIREARKKAKTFLHFALRRDNFGDNSTRLMCEACGCTCWVSHSSDKQRAELPADCSLWVRCSMAPDLTQKDTPDA